MSSSDNITNSSSMMKLNESSCNSSFGCCGVAPTCPGTAVHLSYLSVMCVVGVVSNILLLYADYKEWKKSKTPDKVLIFNLTMSNVAALLVSLPFHALIVANYQDFWRCNGPYFQYYRVQFFRTSLFNFVTLGTLAVIGIDRALTKFAHQRTLNVKRSILAIGLVWLCSIAVVVVFVLTWSLQCSSFSSKDKENDNFYPLRMTIISVWITVCCTVTCFYLWLAARRIRKHRQEINAMFGAVQTAKEISFTKGIIALSLCYVILWIPYGVSSGSFYSDTNNFNSMCVHQWAKSTCHLSFSILPGIYFIMDSRLRRVVVPETNVAPVSMTTQGNRAPKNQTDA